jgi:hypothetical protein
VRGISDDRVAAHENIGAALAVLHRLDSLRIDDDLRLEVTEVRRRLSVAQSRIHKRIRAEEKSS